MKSTHGNQENPSEVVLPPCMGSSSCCQRVSDVADKERPKNRFSWGMRGMRRGPGTRVDTGWSPRMSWRAGPKGLGGAPADGPRGWLVLEKKEREHTPGGREGQRSR